jgi:tetratricopeptide (TPR) repeat protein
MQKLPITAQTLLKRAIAAQQKKRFAEAIELYKKILSKFPQSVDSLQGLGVVMMNSGDTLTAITILGQALQLAQNDIQIRNNYLPALCNHGNYLANQHSRYQDDEHLSRIRLAEQLNTCSLFDTDRFRRHLESAYISMLERHQRGEKLSKLSVQPC